MKIVVDRARFYKLLLFLDRPADEAEPLRDEILRRANDVGLRVISGGCSEIYLENAYRDNAGQPVPNTMLLGDSALMVEVHPTLRAEPLKRRAEALRDIIGAVLSSQD